MLEADARYFLHFFVGRIAAEIGRNDRGVTQHFRNQGVGTAAKCRGQDRTLRVDNINVDCP